MTRLATVSLQRRSRASLKTAVWQRRSDIADAECTVFLHCGAQAGCSLPDNSTLDSQECELLRDANCTLAPTVAARGTSGGVNPLLVSGFPVRSKLPPPMPDLIATQAQGMSGGDFSCPDSVLEGACAFRDVLAANFRCSSLLTGTCSSVVLYANGTSGCEDRLLAVLKSTKPLPDNTYWAPTVSILQKKNEAGTFIMYDEATLIPPDNETQLNELALAPAASGLGNVSASPANTTGTPANGSATLPPFCAEGANMWMGCLVVNLPAVMGGVVNRTIDGVASAEACCRACREAGRTACNVFNWCPENETCSFQDSSSVATLQQQQCELRYQELVDPKNGIPPYLLVKGTAAGSFRAGAPVSAWGPPLPGYDRKTAGGLYGQPGTPCADRFKPDYQECILSAPLPQLADRCSGDPSCAAVISKPCGSLSSSAVNVGVLRQQQGANASLMVHNPTSLVYFKQHPASNTTSTSGGSSLSSGAIAGIAVGCTVAAVAAAAAGWLLVRRRRTPQAAAVEPAVSTDKAMESGCGTSTGWPEGGSYGGVGGVLGIASGGTSASPPFQSALPATMFLDSGCNGNAGSGPVLKEAVIRRATAASPFAAGRRQPSPPASSGNGVPAPVQPVYGAGYPAVGTHSSSDAALLSSGEASEPHVEPELQQEWVIPPEEIHYLKRPNGELFVLGEGASGRVIRAELRGEVVAAKEMDVGRAADLQQTFIREAQQLCNLRHANIVTFYGCCIIKGRGVLLTELWRDLASVLQLENPPGQRVFGWYKHGCRVAFEVAKALNYLHSRNVAHMDIKSNNVLLNSQGVAKLADTHTVMSDLPQMVGTFAWVAPEVLLGGQGCTLAVDMYSFGVLLWEIITGLRPVRGHMRAIQVPAECPQEAADLMAACCALDPSARPSARELMHRLRDLLVAQSEGRRSNFDG
ncbi:hypothetical protein COHA_000877 [Chlorella ohadii]|uniref:Protein kinase domain-containing protein n=1 Tax=Chlorella ohadii TaxID=2649997 RepID=A0AAD5DX17_9CHLO|nr:hypothetical protein COHA_000877 [Chlorella ohadii]